MYSGITSGRVLDDELLYTEILLQHMILPCCCHVLSLWLGKLGLMLNISGLLGTILLCDNCNPLSLFNIALL